MLNKITKLCQHSGSQLVKITKLNDSRQKYAFFEIVIFLFGYVDGRLVGSSWFDPHVCWYVRNDGISAPIYWTNNSSNHYTLIWTRNLPSYCKILRNPLGDIHDVSYIIINKTSCISIVHLGPILCCSSHKHRTSATQRP